MQNSLEIPSIKMVLEIQDIKDKMLELQFDGSIMSCSGSCVFGLTRNELILERVRFYISNTYY